MSGFIFFGQKFIHFWVGDDYYLSYYITLLLIVPVTIPLIQNIGIEIQRAKNKHQFRSIVYLIMAIINVIISIFLCMKFGIIGSTIGTTISFILANGLIMNIYYHKIIKINILKFWKSIFKLSLVMIIPIIFGLIVKFFINYNSILIMLLLIIVYTIIYTISVYIFGISKEDKNKILNRFFYKNK